MLSIGNAEILRVEEMRHVQPIARFGADEALIRDNLAWLAPDFLDTAEQSFSLVFQAWIVRFDGRVIVVDPCNGNGRERPAFPFFHQLDTPFIERFEATGVRPEDVNIVFCTHLHCDHCGWNTRLKGGRWVPTFPNARYLFVRREVASWAPGGDGLVAADYNVGVYDDSVRPIIDAGLADLVGDRHDIGERVSIEAAHGHSAGHSVLHLNTDAGEVVFAGDAFHHPLQVLDPRLHLMGCYNLEAAIATRERLRALAADRGALMIPAHFPGPHCGRVTRRGGEYLFSPGAA